MQGIALKRVFDKTPHISLGCKLVPFLYREYCHGLLVTEKNILMDGLINILLLKIVDKNLNVSHSYVLCVDFLTGCFIQQECRLYSV